MKNILKFVVLKILHNKTKKQTDNFIYQRVFCGVLYTGINTVNSINKFIKLAIILDKEFWIDFLNIIHQSNEFNKQEFKEKLFALSEKTNDKNLKKIIYEYIKI